LGSHPGQTEELASWRAYWLVNIIRTAAFFLPTELTGSPDGLDKPVMDQSTPVCSGVTASATDRLELWGLAGFKARYWVNRGSSF
jgi:hypothetical protein